MKRSLLLSRPLGIVNGPSPPHTGLHRASGRAAPGPKQSSSCLGVCQTPLHALSLAIDVSTLASSPTTTPTTSKQGGVPASGRLLRCQRADHLQAWTLRRRRAPASTLSVRTQDLSAPAGSVLCWPACPRARYWRGPLGPPPLPTRWAGDHQSRCGTRGPRPRVGRRRHMRGLLGLGCRSAQAAPSGHGEALAPCWGRSSACGYLPPAASGAAWPPEHPRLGVLSVAEPPRVNDCVDQDGGDWWYPLPSSMRSTQVVVVFFEAPLPPAGGSGEVGLTPLHSQRPCVWRPSPGPGGCLPCSRNCHPDLHATL